MRPFFTVAANSLFSVGAKNATACAQAKRRLWRSVHLRGGLLVHLSKTDKLEFIVVPYIMPLLWKVQRFKSYLGQLAEACTGSGKPGGKKIKRAGPSHKPHPKATCPHPTRPLRPPGRRARRAYYSTRTEKSNNNFAKLRPSGLRLEETPRLAPVRADRQQQIRTSVIWRRQASS